ncbi:MAG: beta-ketoacyl synthase chain length factor [Thiovulaceae bacterium]|nr:beta-ketoacyl synthase chain length factor [Sulfurimonadaceae bacterium]
MKKVALKIVSAAKIAAPVKIENLDEKRIVPKMLLRRRLTRNAKIMLYLSDKCNFSGGKVVYGSCYSEIQETVVISNAILNKEPISPTSFQNSVYNSAPSYFSLVHNDKDEIITISSGMHSSRDALKTAALQALVSGEKVLCVATECLNIERIEEVNRCTTFLEAGAAVVLEIDKDATDAQEIKGSGDDGIIESLQDLVKVVNMYENGTKNVLIEL